MDTLSVNQLKEVLTKYKNCKGKWNSLKIKNDSQFVNSLIYHTAFLSDSASYSERIYCIQNDIKQQPVCNITHKNLRWNANKHCYAQSKSEGYRSRVQNFKWVKNNVTNCIDKLYTIYSSNNYTILTTEQCISKGITYIQNRSVSPYLVLKDLDLWCSILKHTQFCNQTAKWSERLYLIKHNITSPVLAKDGGLAKFISFKRGYSPYSSRQNLNTYNLLTIINVIENQGFKVLSDDKIDNKFIKIRCNVCNTEKHQMITCGLYNHITCNKCTGYGIHRSKYEDDIKNFIYNHNPDTKIELNVKTDIGEIDIYLPEYKIGIEFHGILWHSFGTNYPNTSNIESKTKYKTSKKYEYCKSNNIQLITIFENEWLLKQDIVKSMILAKLKLNHVSIYARKCTIKDVSLDEKREFLLNNHIQGQCQSFYNIGLYNDNKLVALMSFSRRKLGKNNTNNIELVRFACKTYTNVVGGFSKLLKYAENQLNKNIICYCDKRYSLGNVYIKTGFKLQSESPPNYFYTKDCINLESRIKYQKHKLTSMHSYDSKLTESQIMYNNNYRKIYDCGNYVFIKPLK